MPGMVNRCLTLLLLSSLLGCSPDSRSYSVSVKNETVSYLTLNPAKDVPQNEPLWATPEDLDQERVMMRPSTELGAVTVPPGKTGSAHNLTGHFPGNTQAILRVYRGKDLLLRELLNMQPGVDRQDVVLQPGENKFVVRDYQGGLTVTPVGK
jgi:hypothetical protein